ncbi:hypothetical protein H1S01_10715 [Heliobacterium chlorum]|uniref:Uncharacterized protein n=1 Tax=Heliobacterium chlorum TaxID=2698 RepID=A0ABR7T3Q9_HELCL|nr:hypothetical protein [Heliobacterium chlorum]MBC9784980.1 hypothetical protein [Heliobacterium chlorum]
MRSFLFKAIASTILAAVVILIAIVVKTIRGSKSSLGHGGGDADFAVISDGDSSR